MLRYHFDILGDDRDSNVKAKKREKIREIG